MDDSRLKELFTEPDLEDDGFSDSVMRRIHAGNRLRGIVLTAAGLIGAIIALPALASLATDFNFTLARMAGALELPTLAGHTKIVLIAALTAAACMLVARFPER